VRFPLPARRDYKLVLRVDPVAPEARQLVRLQLNRRPLGVIDLGWNPDRVGSYQVEMPADIVRAGSNQLLLMPEPLLPAGSAGPRFAWLPPDERIGVRVWYIRVLP
jgi:hypothetical protein